MMLMPMTIDPQRSSNAARLSGVARRTASRTSDARGMPRIRLILAENISTATIVGSKTRTVPSCRRITIPSSSASRSRRRSRSFNPIDSPPPASGALELLQFLQAPLQLLTFLDLQFHARSSEVDVEDLGDDGPVGPIDAPLEHVVRQGREAFFDSRYLRRSGACLVTLGRVAPPLLC